MDGKPPEDVTGHLACRYNDQYLPGTPPQVVAQDEVVLMRGEHRKVSRQLRIPLRPSLALTSEASPPIKKAGPMQEWDWLYAVMALLSIIILAAVSMVIFGLPWFTLTTLPAGQKTSFSLFDGAKCEGRPTKGASVDYVCIDLQDGFAVWLQVLQVLAPVALVLGVTSLVLQLSNFMWSSRNTFVHFCSIGFMGATGIVLSVAGHVAHNRAVWASLQHRHAGSLRTEPLISGLLLLSSTLAAVVCVLGHVSSHSPGLLSFQPSFVQDYIWQVFSLPPPPRWNLDTMEKGDLDPAPQQEGRRLSTSL